MPFNPDAQPESVPISRLRTTQAFLGPEKVRHYRSEIRSGKALEPIYTVHDMQTGLHHVVDGHHRFAALQAEGVPHATVEAVHKEPTTAEAQSAVHELIKPVSTGGMVSHRPQGRDIKNRAAQRHIVDKALKKAYSSSKMQRMG